MDTKDISTITAVPSPQFPSSPTAFLGYTLQELQDWLDENIIQPYPCFLVLDDKTVEDNSCILVLQDNSGGISSLRSTFEVVVRILVSCDLGEPIGSVLKEFVSTGLTRTKKNKWGLEAKEREEESEEEESEEEESEEVESEEVESLN